MMNHDTLSSSLGFRNDNKLNYASVGYLETPLLLSQSSHITFDQSSDFTAWWWPTVDTSENLPPWDSLHSHSTVGTSSSPEMSSRSTSSASTPSMRPIPPLEFDGTLASLEYRHNYPSFDLAQSALQATKDIEPLSATRVSPSNNEATPPALHANIISGSYAAPLKSMACPANTPVHIDALPETRDETYWNAVTVRDASLVGLMWYGVTSTKIYCRPTCPSRRPKRVNIVFFESCDSAEHAGYRPCLRCTPRDEHDPSQVRQTTAVVQAAKLISEAVKAGDKPPGLEALAHAVGMSPFYLHRTFKKKHGVSPKVYANQLVGSRP